MIEKLKGGEYLCTLYVYIIIFPDYKMCVSAWVLACALSAICVCVHRAT